MIDSTIFIPLLRGMKDTLSASSAYLLCNSPDAVIKCRQCRLCTFTHCNYYLFVGNVRDISCQAKLPEVWCGKKQSILISPIGVVSSMSRKGALLAAKPICTKIPSNGKSRFFTTYTIFDADSCYLITVSHYLCGL